MDTWTHTCSCTPPPAWRVSRPPVAPSSARARPQTKQEVWALEKQRADLASELDRTRQEQDFLEGECSSLRVRERGLTCPSPVR